MGMGDFDRSRSDSCEDCCCCCFCGGVGGFDLPTIGMGDFDCCRETLTGVGVCDVEEVTEDVCEELFIDGDIFDSN